MRRPLSERPMTSAHVTPFSELERDALSELSNIAMARAANSLRQMVEYQVMLSVPQRGNCAKGSSNRTR